MKEKGKKILLWLLDLTINLGIIIGLVIVIQTWIIAPFDISGSSMCNTLNYLDDQCQTGFGEKIIINEAIYIWGTPQREDIVVFKSPYDEDKYFIKRVIGVPGDEIAIKKGYIYLKKAGASEEIKLEEPYLNDENRGKTEKFYTENFIVPDDHYFLLGDNRHSSTDSRSCFESRISPDCDAENPNAYVSRDSIRGKAWVVWWPLKSMRVLKHQYSESLAEK